MHRSCSDFNQAYHFILRDLLDNGQECSPRGMKVKEILNYSYTVENPEKDTVTFVGWPGRQETYEKYRSDEHDWYMSGNLRADSAPSKFWLKLADKNGLINSNYGHMVFKDEKIPYYMDDNITSFEYTVLTLKNDPDSRQALIHYGHPGHFTLGCRDTPCTISQQFFIRNNKLHCTTTMRSNDAIKGVVYDHSWFVTVMKELLKMLSKEEKFSSLSLGTYTHNVGSMHIYEKDWENAKNEVEIHFGVKD